MYQKTFKDADYRQRRNRGELDRFYESGHHAAIVSREEFFRRTRYVPEEGVFGEGKLCRFSDELTVRFLDRVTVLDDGYEVRFKCGIIVRV